MMSNRAATLGSWYGLVAAAAQRTAFDAPDTGATQTLQFLADFDGPDFHSDLFAVDGRTGAIRRRRRTPPSSTGSRRRSAWRRPALRHGSMERPSRCHASVRRRSRSAILGPRATRPSPSDPLPIKRRAFRTRSGAATRARSLPSSPPTSSAGRTTRPRSASGRTSRSRAPRRSGSDSADPDARSRAREIRSRRALVRISPVRAPARGRRRTRRRSHAHPRRPDCRCRRLPEWRCGS